MRNDQRSVAAFMIRVFLFVVAVGVVLLLGGVAYLGMFPPNPAQHEVDKTLPNDKFPSH
jgi:hypothetical protein